MERFEDQALLISMKPHGESSVIAHFLTENHGRVAGYIRGAQTNSRQRGLLQLGSVLNVEWSARNEEQLGQYQIGDVVLSTVPAYDAPLKIKAIQSITRLMEICVGEREAGGSNLFHGSLALLSILLETDDVKDWMPVYIFWEMAFLKQCGFSIDLEKCVVSGDTDNLIYVSPKSGCAVSRDEGEPYAHKLLKLPDFLTTRTQPITVEDLRDGLHLTGFFILRRLLAHTSHEQLPSPRLELLDSLTS